MSSLWGHLDSRLTDDGNRSVAYFQSDSQGFDVGALLAATRSDLPFMDPTHLAYDTALGSGNTFQVNRELFSPPELKDSYMPSYYVAVKHVKIAHKTADARSQLLRSVIREVRVMMHPALRDHACIIPVLAYGWDHNPRFGAMPYIVTDYTQFGTMKEYLERVDTVPSERWELAIDVAIGLSVLHQNGIAHGDVKQGNVLIFDVFDSQPDRAVLRPQMAKLADFGSVIFEDDEESSSCTYLGTPVYNAPEIQGWGSSSLKLRFSDCCKADVYSFGILLWEIMSGGGFFLREILRTEDTDPMAFLQRLNESPTDSLLNRANEFLLGQDFEEKIFHAVQSTFEACLDKTPSQRLNMEAVSMTLASGTSIRRPAPTYPMLVEAPPTSRTAMELSIPPGYYTTSSAPDIAIPSPGLADPNKPLYIKRFDHTKGQWVSTTELDQRKSSKFMLGPPLERPKDTRKPRLDQKAIDMFKISADTSPPWDFQCRIVDRLKMDVIRETDAVRKASAHLQLSVSYHIGFGCSPDASQTIRHLWEARGHSQIAGSLFWPVYAALSSESKLDGLDEIPALKSEQSTSCENIGTEGYRARITATVKTSIANEMTGEAVWNGRALPLTQLVGMLRDYLKGSRSIDVSDRVMLRGTDGTSRSASLLEYAVRRDDSSLLNYLIDALTFQNSDYLQALLMSCKAGNFDLARIIGRKCVELSVTWDNDIWPTPMHWLFMFDPAEAEVLIAMLCRMVPTGQSPEVSPVSHFETHTQAVVDVPELGIEFFGTPLHWAVRTGNTILVNLLLDSGANINSQLRLHHIMPENGLRNFEITSYTPLDVAVTWHLYETVQLLLQRGADTLRGEFWGDPPAICSLGSPVPSFARYAIHGSRSVLALKRTIETLTQHGCDLESKTVVGDTVLQFALAHCDQERYILQGLVEAGCRADALSDDVLLKIARDSSLRRCSTARLDAVLPLVRDVNYVDEYDRGVLYYAAQAASSVVVERLLGDDRLEISGNWYSIQNPVTAAAQVGSLGVVARLIEAGLDFDARDDSGRTPLVGALAARQSATAVVLVSAGAATTFNFKTYNDDQATSGKGHETTALILATTSRNQASSILTEIMESDQLRERSLLNFPDSDDWTVLHHAAWFGDYEGVCTLLEAGANPVYKSRNGSSQGLMSGTPLEVVCKLLIKLNGLGEHGWQESENDWVSRGGLVVWRAYLANLKKIVAALDGVTYSDS